MRITIDIKFEKMALLHSYQKHGYNKSKIMTALESGIINVVQGKKNHKLIYTMDLTTIIIDEEHNFLTAYKTTNKQYNTKKIKGLNGGK